MVLMLLKIFLTISVLAWASVAFWRYAEEELDFEYETVAAYGGMSIVIGAVSGLLTLVALIWSF